MMIDMKNTFKYLLAAVCAAPMILSGCQREVELDDAPARITVRIADNDPQTRTSYDNLEGKFTWNEGDEIAIHHVGGKYETFAVSPNSDPTTGSVISSTVAGKVRNDFAVYPASAAVATADGAAPKVSLPAEYDLTALTDVDETFAPAILLAENVADEDLAFYHAGGLVRFVLTDLAATTTKIVVTFDKNVTGEFDVVTDDADEPVPYIETGDGENTVVTFTVSSDVIGTDKAIDLNLPVPCGTYEWAKVETFAGDALLSTLMHNAPMEFARHHGKRVAFVETEDEFYVGNQDATSTELGKIVVPSGTPTLDNDGGILTLAPAFVSYKVNGENVEPVPFKMQFSTDKRSWTDVLPEWISFAGTVDPNGSVPEYPQELSIIIDPLKNLIPMTEKGVPMPEGSRTANLQAKSDAGTVDLSTINVATGAPVATSTANCYVVDAPGTYTFPFVYGNGVKDGEINQPAFRGMQKNADTGVYEFRPDEETAYNGQAKAHILGRFQNHNGDLITTPYIAEQLGSTNFTAKVLWMDQPGLIESATFVPGNTAQDAHIEFVVSHAGIAQGNALIGALDQNGTIVWSWHIWVTDEDLTATKNLKGYQSSPVSLGFCNQVQIAQYRRLTGYVRIVQDIAGGKATNYVTITVGTDSDPKRYANGPHYVPGRKDPIVGFDGDRDVVGDKKVYPTREEGNPYYPQYAILDLTTLAGSIQHPYIQYYPESGRTPSRWMDITYGNLWNSTQTVFTTGEGVYSGPDKVTKTIYDPSPVGYRVPGPATYAGIAFDDMVATAQGSAPDGIRLYTVDEATMVCLGLREKYLRYISSALVYYLTSDMVYGSNRFVGTEYYLHGSHRTSNVTSMSSAASVLPVVDE